MGKKLLIPLSLLFLIFLFVGSPEDLPTRSLKHAWDIGHIIIFILWTTLLLRISENHKTDLSFFKKLLLIFIMVNAFGIIVEFIQGMIGRSNDLEDIFKNLTGSLIAIAFYGKLKNRLTAAGLNCFRASVLLLLLTTLIPLGKSVCDEVLITRQFPLLAGFESPFELERWDSYHQIVLSDKPVTEGNHSLKVLLITEQYSGISLDYFFRDWSDYATLKLDIFNPSDDILPIVIRIHDAFHKMHNNAYQDRFNRPYDLKKGWNRITISLEAVMLAPEERRMDMSAIENIRLFVIKLDNPATIFLDNVRLER